MYICIYIHTYVYASEHVCCQLILIRIMTFKPFFLEHMYLCVYYMCIFRYICMFRHMKHKQNIGLFCRIQSLLYRSFAKETYV